MEWGEAMRLGIANWICERMTSLQFAPQEGEAMLVLTRRRDESIVLYDRDGREIRLSVLEIRGQKIRLGIEAPPEIEIYREETLPHESFAEEFLHEAASI